MATNGLPLLLVAGFGWCRAPGRRAHHGDRGGDAQGAQDFDRPQRLRQAARNVKKYLASMGVNVPARNAG